MSISPDPDQAITEIRGPGAGPFEFLSPFDMTSEISCVLAVEEKADRRSEIRQLGDFEFSVIKTVTGGEVTLLVPMLSTEILYVARRKELLQSFVPNDTRPHFLDPIEKAFDRAVRVLSQQKQEIDRCLRIGVGGFQSQVSDSDTDVTTEYSHALSTAVNFADNFTPFTIAGIVTDDGAGNVKITINIPGLADYIAFPSGGAPVDSQFAIVNGVGLEGLQVEVEINDAHADATLQIGLEQISSDYKTLNQFGPPDVSQIEGPGLTAGVKTFKFGAGRNRPGLRFVRLSMVVAGDAGDWVELTGEIKIKRVPVENKVFLPIQTQLQSRPSLLGTSDTNTVGTGLSNAKPDDFDWLMVEGLDSYQPGARSPSFVINNTAPGGGVYSWFNYFLDSTGNETFGADESDDSVVMHHFGVAVGATRAGWWRLWINQYPRSRVFETADVSVDYITGFWTGVAIDNIGRTASFEGSFLLDFPSGPGKIVSFTFQPSPLAGGDLFVSRKLNVWGIPRESLPHIGDHR
jgi:hypothetical protein